MRIIPTIRDHEFVHGGAVWRSRVTYLPSASRILSMMDNWERTLEAASGRYVTFIGDDDYADPDLAVFLVNLEANVGAIDALCWIGFGYNGPWKVCSRGLCNSISRRR